MKTFSRPIAFARPLLAAAVAMVCFYVLSNNAFAQCNPTPPGIVDWWPGEGNGNDLLGGNAAMAEGGVTYTTGEVGQAFSFDGSTGFLATTDQISNPQNFTLECWFQTAAALGPGGVLIGFSGSQTQTGVGEQYDRFIYMDDEGYLHFGVYNNNTVTADSVLPYNDGAWHHVAATQSTTDGISLYVDGALVANNPDGTSPQNYDGWWRIGEDNLANWPDQPASYYFQGAIDEVSIYSRALSAAEVQSIYNAGISGKCALPSAVYVGNPLSSSGSPDGVSPLVILGEYDPAPAGPLGASSLVLPSGTITDVQFYGDNYNFTLYVLSPVGPGPYSGEQTFQVVDAESFSGSAPTGVQDLQTSGFAVSPGDLLAFAGIGPYYVGANDAYGSDATYEDSGNGNFFATAPSTAPGTTFTVGVNPDPNATYEYVPDFFMNQGRTYQIGVEVVEVVGTATQLQVVAPPTATAGQTVDVTINALDGAGNPTTATPSVTFTTSDGYATYPSIVTLVNGSATFTVTFGTAGAQTVTATDAAENNPLIPSTSSVTVSASPAVNVVWVLPGVSQPEPGNPDGIQTGFILTQTAGVPFTAIVESMDAFYNPVASSDTLQITSSDPNAEYELPSQTSFSPVGNVTLVNGTATFQLILNTVGSGSQQFYLTDITPNGLLGINSQNNTTPIPVISPPALTIGQSGSGAVISWPSPSTGFFLQTNSNLATTNWAVYTGTIVTNGDGTTNSVTLTPTVGNLFFRLSYP